MPRICTEAAISDLEVRPWLAEDVSLDLETLAVNLETEVTALRDRVYLGSFDEVTDRLFAT
jgi:hypothetical protein